MAIIEHGGRSPMLRRAPSGDAPIEPETIPPSNEVAAHEERTETDPLYASLADLSELANSTKRARLRTSVESDRLPSHLQMLMRGLRMIDRVHRSVEHPTAPQKFDDNVKGVFYQAVGHKESGEPVSLYVFDTAWRTREPGSKLSHVRVQAYENPNGSFIHTIDAHSRRGLVKRLFGKDSTPSKQFGGSLSLPVQREILNDLVALFDRRIPALRR